MSVFPEIFSIGHKGKLLKMSPEEFDKDPRGIVWMWEPPISTATYVVGIDPSVGITGWNRYSRVKDDRKTNNGVVEIIRLGKNGAQDSQVCEFAAPVDAADIGYVANTLGRLYHGTEEDQCLCIGELSGPGGITLRTMTECGYLNHWMWQYYGELVPVESRRVWWNATSNSLKDLWIKCSRHITLHKTIIRSPWLADEYADARYDAAKMYAYSSASTKGHGDRCRAFNLGLWAANGWSMDVERTTETVSTTPSVIDPQSSDMTWENIEERWGLSMGTW